MKRPRDVNQNAHLSILLATGQVEKDSEERFKPDRVNKDALPRGRQRSGVARAPPRSPRRDDQR